MPEGRTKDEWLNVWCWESGRNDYAFIRLMRARDLPEITLRLTDGEYTYSRTDGTEEKGIVSVRARTRWGGEESRRGENPPVLEYATGDTLEESVLAYMRFRRRELGEDSKEAWRNTAFTLYGFAAQAEMLGDHESGRIAREFAEELMPRLREKGYRGRFIVPLPTPRVVCGGRA